MKPLFIYQVELKNGNNATFAHVHFRSEFKAVEYVHSVFPGTVFAWLDDYTPIIDRDGMYGKAKKHVGYIHKCKVR